jgi:putative serine protease PepD
VTGRGLRRRSRPLAVVVAALGGLAAGFVIGQAPEATAVENGARVAASASSAAAQTKTPVQVARTALRGVVTIVSTYDVDTPFGAEEQVGEGAGIVLDKQGRMLTSEHVVGEASKIHVTLADGTKAHAEIVATDPLLDLAVIRAPFPAAGLHPLALGSAEGLELGETVLAIGNPFGLARSISVGVVSGLDRQIVAPNGFTVANTVQTDAAVNHGNSGGPLLDLNGRVVGVNAQIANSGVDANVGVAFAIAIDRWVRRAVDRLRAGQAVRHPWLGLNLADVDAILATSGRVAATSGALVAGVVPGGPADAAGLRGGTEIVDIDGLDYCLGGDIVTAIGGRRIMDSGGLQTAIRAFSPGQKVKLAVVAAGGAKRTVTLTLGTQPATAPGRVTGCG